MNLYAFCRNNGVNAWDYLGLLIKKGIFGEDGDEFDQGAVDVVGGIVPSSSSSSSGTYLLTFSDGSTMSVTGTYATAVGVGQALSASYNGAATVVGRLASSNLAGLNASIAGNFAASASSSYAVASASISSSVSATLASAYGGFQQSISASVASVPVLPIGNVNVNGALRSAGLGAGEFLNPDRSIGWNTLSPNAVRPVYDPDSWNDGGSPYDGVSIQGNSNCYAYALDRRGPFNGQFGLQPGNLSGTGPRYPTITVDAIRQRAIDDGLSPVPISGGYPVYLVVDPGDWVVQRPPDYHWYRQDDTGLWSHKRGVYPVTNLDGSGNVITDPSAANTGDYTEHGGYLWVPIN